MHFGNNCQERAKYRMVDAFLINESTYGPYDMDVEEFSSVTGKVLITEKKLRFLRNEWLSI